MKIHIMKDKIEMKELFGGGKSWSVMRSWSVLAVPLIVVFVAVTAQAQTDVPLPEPGALQRVDSAKVKFLIYGPCGYHGSNDVSVGVRGMVARDVDLTDDKTALEILRMGIALGQEQLLPANCKLANASFQGQRTPHYVTVELRIGDPAAFTTPNPPGFNRPGFGTAYDTLPDEVGAMWSERQATIMRGYRNVPKDLKLQRQRNEQQARQQNAALEQQRQAEQARQAQLAARSAAFVKANGVSRYVTVQQLAANPFVYQGQVVAIYGVFQQMNSATQGLFSSQDKQFVVSAIPAGKFTQQNSMVMLAGRVLGNVEVKLPVLGPTLVPNLSFVGSAFCQQQGCSEYSIK